uniref:Transposase n=1 Tax=Solibacter usitatus (strain Ellin6076) TaxID=234267 RepID=Q01XB0_SOLUE
MAAKTSAPAPQEKRFTAYIDWLAQAVGHADRNIPLRNYCTGLLLDGERKSVEPMAARLAPDHVQGMHESLHHFVAKSPWSDFDMLRQVRNYVLPAMEKKCPVTAWIVDETSYVKKGTHSVGVARQYCGRLGKKENCQVAVSLSVATATGSLPIAWQLYLTEDWASDQERRRQTGVPPEISFQTKPQIALAQIQRAVAEKVPLGVLLADEIYGSNREFRDGVAELKLEYSLAVRSNTTVWALDRQPLPPKPWNGKGRQAQRMRRDPAHQPITVKQLAQELPQQIWSEVAWREGSKGTLQSRFAALRVRPAYGDDRKGSLRPEEWLLIEWPKGSDEPSAYWLSNLPEKTRLKDLVGTSNHRWVIERDYEELKSELGLAHYEGRNWRGFHHHATLCIAAYGFLIAERSRFSPSAYVGHLGLRARPLPPQFRPRGAKDEGRTA